MWLYGHAPARETAPRKIPAFTLCRDMNHDGSRAYETDRARLRVPWVRCSSSGPMGNNSDANCDGRQLNERSDPFEVGLFKAPAPIINCVALVAERLSLCQLAQSMSRLLCDRSPTILAWFHRAVSAKALVRDRPVRGRFQQLGHSGPCRRNLQLSRDRTH